MNPTLELFLDNFFKFYALFIYLFFKLKKKKELDGAIKIKTTTVNFVRVIKNNII